VAALAVAVAVSCEQVAPRASRPSRAVLNGAARGRPSWHSARRVPRLCASLPLVALPDNPRGLSSAARFGPRAGAAWGAARGEVLGRSRGLHAGELVSRPARPPSRAASAKHNGVMFPCSPDGVDGGSAHGPAHGRYVRRGRAHLEAAAVLSLRRSFHAESHAAGYA
jgi:hypothetical protein